MLVSVFCFVKPWTHLASIRRNKNMFYNDESTGGSDSDEQKRQDGQQQNGDQV